MGAAANLEFRLLKHCLIASAYTFPAVAVALVLPGMVPAVSLPEAWLAGAVVALMGLIAHESWARSEATALTGAIGQAQHEHLRAFRHDLDRVQRDILRLDETLSALAEGSESRARKDLDRIVSEVRVLQDLIERLSIGGAMKDANRENGPENGPKNRPEDSKADAVPVRADLGEAEILHIVREGLRRDRVDLYLQPVVSLPQRKTRFYECFSRIRAEDGAIIMPGQYIDVAKREGLIGTIDNLLLFRCVQLVRRAQSRNHSVGFFCNISANTLADRAFFSDFTDFLESNKELARHLIFEFRQDDMAGHGREIDDDIARLGRLGFYFSLDRVHDLTRLDIPALARKRFKYIKVESGYLLQHETPEGASRGEGAAVADGGTSLGERASGTSLEERASGTSLKERASGATLEERASGATTLLGVNVAALKRDLDVHGIDLIVEKLESEQDLVELLDYRIDFGQGYLFGEPRLSREA